MMRTEKVINKQKEIWIDNIKLFACVLVAFGHFFMSMVESGILPDSSLHKWFIRTIYYFHVPLFFMCSGYLYQKKSSVTTGISWKNHILKKAVALAVPYFVFSIATWVLKNIFSGSVNTQNDGLLITLFVKPSSPYWYLYTLFFLFAITPTFSDRKIAVIGLTAAIALKYIRAADFFTIDIYAIKQTMDCMVWFVSGMCMCVFRIPDVCRSRVWQKYGLLCAGIFLSISCMDLPESVSEKLVMGSLGCVSVFLVILNGNPTGMLKTLVKTLSRYTMPVYLMHTIFAAGIRAVLIKLGIVQPTVHIAAGLFASFAGPIVAAWVMERLKLDFVIYPSKYWKGKSRQGASL